MKTVSCCGWEPGHNQRSRVVRRSRRRRRDDPTADFGRALPVFSRSKTRARGLFDRNTGGARRVSSTLRPASVKSSEKGQTNVGRVRSILAHPDRARYDGRCRAHATSILRAHRSGAASAAQRRRVHRATTRSACSSSPTASAATPRARSRSQESVEQICGFVRQGRPLIAEFLKEPRPRREARSGAPAARERGAERLLHGVRNGRARSVAEGHVDDHLGAAHRRRLRRHRAGGRLAHLSRARRRAASSSPRITRSSTTSSSRASSAKPTRAP